MPTKYFSAGLAAILICTSTPIFAKSGNDKLSSSKSKVHQILSDQIKRCWKVPIRRKNYPIVTLYFKLNKSGGVQGKITNPVPLENVRDYKALASAAATAIKNCAPYNLPLNDFHIWHRMSYAFQTMPSVAPVDISDRRYVALRLMDEKKFSEAENVLKSALTISEKFYGKSSNSAVVLYGHLVKALTYQSRLVEAEATAIHHLSLLEKSKGPQHLKSRQAALKLWGIHHLQGKPSKSLETLEKALRNYRSQKGQWRQKELQAAILNRIASIYQTGKNWEMARRFSLKAKSLLDKISSKKSAEHLNAYLNLGITQIELGNYSKAITYLKRASSINSDETDPSLYVQLSILQSLGRAHLKSKQYRKAEKYYIRALEVDSKIRAQRQPNSVESNVTKNLKRGLAAARFALKPKDQHPEVTVTVLDEPKGWLGIDWQRPTRWEVEKSKGQSSKSFKVLRCVKGGPACDAGLKGNDKILSVDGREFDSRKALGEYLIAKSPGSIVNLNILRGAKKLVVRVNVASYESAAVIYEKSAVAGDTHSMFILGYLYEKGRGVAQDYEKAGLWYVRASDNGHPGAMYHLGLFYLKGLGTPVNRTLGRLWLDRAADAGNAEATAAIKRIWPQ